MSLKDALTLERLPLPLPPGEPPYPCARLGAVAGTPFWMPPGDPRLEDVLRVGRAPAGPMQNLEGADRLWRDDPAWMDLLDPNSPAHDSKLLERDLYLHHWERHLGGAERVLDLGAGAGRFTQWLLARGKELEAVDPDLRSLWRILAHVAGGPGRLDLHWTTGERLPPLRSVDAVLAVEVLCYVEEPRLVVEEVIALLRPGGVLLLSVEARRGWAAALDAAEGSLEALFGDGVVDVPGDRWVRTYEEEEVRALLEGFSQVDVWPSHYVTGGPFEAAAGVRTLDELLRWEERCAASPVTSPWNRAWTAVARL